MPELRIELTDEQFHDLACAAGLSGRTIELFVTMAVLDEAHGLVQDLWPICERLGDHFEDLIRRLR